MNQERQVTIERWLNKHEAHLNGLIRLCKDSEEASFVMCANTQDMIRKFHHLLVQFAGTQPAKAALKVAIDCVLLDYGMSVAIHEFDT